MGTILMIISICLSVGFIIFLVLNLKPLIVFFHLLFPKGVLRKLNVVGIQISDHIYTFSKWIQVRDQRTDLVFLNYSRDKISGYRLFHRDYFEIPLVHPKIGTQLVYYKGYSETPIPYYPGSPFELKEGYLVLYLKKRKGFGFTKTEIARGNKWPLEVAPST